MATIYRGCDLSHWELDADHDKVRADGIKFCIAKCTESTYFIDDKWSANRNGCIRVGTPISAYHFHRFDRDAIQQAKFFESNLQSPVPMMLWDDVETVVASVLGVERGSNAETYIKARTALETKINNTTRVLGALSSSVSYYINTKFGNVDAVRMLDGITKIASETLSFMKYFKRCGMYSSPGFIKAFFGNPAPIELSNFYLWIANTEVSKPYIPYPWSTLGEWPNNPKVPIWQDTWSLSVDGISSAVDGDWYTDAAGDLYAFFENGSPENNPPILPSKVYVNSDVYSLNIRTEPSDIHGSVTICGTTSRNKVLKPEDIMVDSKGREWYKITAYVAKWYTHT